MHPNVPVIDSIDPGTLPSVDVLGVRIQSVTIPQTLELLTAMALGSRHHYAVTVNPEFVMMAQVNIQFREVLNRADLAVADGTGVVWAARLFGLPIQERITGVDTLERIAALAATREFSIFLLGAAPGVAEKTALELCRRYPGLKIAGTFSGSPKLEDEDQIIALINSARPHFLFVAYGSPAQELWIGRNLHRIDVPVSMGVGGTFDFIAGVTLRAPRAMQRLGLEWLHRLILQPRRWRRMLALPRFAVAVLLRRFTSSPPVSRQNPQPSSSS